MVAPGSRNVLRALASAIPTRASATLRLLAPLLGEALVNAAHAKRDADAALATVVPALGTTEAQPLRVFALRVLLQGRNRCTLMRSRDWSCKMATSLARKPSISTWLAYWHRTRISCAVVMAYGRCLRQRMPKMVVTTMHSGDPDSRSRLKLRAGAAGIHLFDRTTGLNLLWTRFACPRRCGGCTPVRLSRPAERLRFAVPILLCTRTFGKARQYAVVCVGDRT